MHTEIFCNNLDKLDKVKAIRAVHQAYLQLAAIDAIVESDENIMFANGPVIARLAEVLADAGHPAFDGEA